MSVEEDNLYAKTINKWGMNAQIIMALEEMNELGVELCHALRDRGDAYKISEEIADVSIMLKQMAYLFNIRKTVAHDIKVKLERLEKRILEE